MPNKHVCNITRPDGIVGYYARLTRERSPVRSWVRSNNEISIFFLLLLTHQHTRCHCRVATLSMLFLHIHICRSGYTAQHDPAAAGERQLLYGTVEHTTLLLTQRCAAALRRSWVISTPLPVCCSSQQSAIDVSVCAVYEIVGQPLLGERSITAEMGWTVGYTLSVVVLVLVVSLSLLVRAAPVYDCAYDASRLPMCEWSTDELHSKFSQLLTQSGGSGAFGAIPSSFPSVLRAEDVDGNVFLSLEPSEIDFLLDKTGATQPGREASRQAVVAAMQQLMAPSSQQSAPPTTPAASAASPTNKQVSAEEAASADTSAACAPLLDGLPSHERKILTILQAEVQQIRQQPASLFPTSSATARYTGRWPSAAYQRIIPRLLQSPSPPRVIVLYGEYEVDLSFALTAYQPHALIIQLADRRPTDSASSIADKLSKRKSGAKRGKAAVINLQLPMREAVCLLIEAGIQPDLSLVSPWLFPIADSCCRWWQHSVVAGYQPDYRMLHQFALQTGHRIYNDQPLYVLSTPISPVRCIDWLGDAIQPDAPVLGLYMIVKNELGGMADTMHSVLPYLDGLSVLDTGSDDGTVELIERLMAEYGVAGAVHHGPFTDFSTTRNDALRLATATLNTTFLLMLNGDDTLIGGEQMLEFLSYRVHQCGPSDEMYLASIDYEGHKLAWSERIMRTSNHHHPDWPSTRWWHYTGVTHEHYTHDEYASGRDGDYAMTYAGRAMGANDDGMHWHIYHTYVRDDRDKLKRRAAKDAELLLGQLKQLPDDPRTMYYLSHSYDIQEDYVEAYKWHQRRTAAIVAAYRTHEADRRNTPLPVADKEECTCLLRLGKIAAFRLESLHGWDEAEQWLELTRALCREQIECRFYLAEHYAMDGNYEKAWVYAKEAEALHASGAGLQHVLESELIRDRLPPLVDGLKQVMNERDSSNVKSKGKKKKKRSAATGVGVKKDEL